MSDWQVYTHLVPVEGAPDKPERFEIEVAGESTPILTYSQDGFPDAPVEQIFIDLETLVALGGLAQKIIDGTAIPTRESSETARD